jgi:hypothetical protein
MPTGFWSAFSRWIAFDSFVWVLCFGVQFVMELMLLATFLLRGHRRAAGELGRRSRLRSSLDFGFRLHS